MKHKVKNKPNMFIVKVQKPIYPPDSNGYLVYNKSKNISFQGDIPQAIKTIIDYEDEPKMYFYARLQGTLIAFHSVAPYQDW